MTEPRKVCIVGYSYTSRDLAPFGDSSFEFWGCNSLYKVADESAEWDRWFEVHSDDVFEAFEPEHIDWLKQCAIPVYMIHAREWCPTAVEYPLDDVQRAMVGRWRFSPSERNYLASTIAMQVALALLEGVDEIHLYGVDMVKESEYGYQRPNLEAWIQTARHQRAKSDPERMVEVFVPEESALMKPPRDEVYAYSVKTGVLPPMFLETVKMRLEAHQREISDSEQELEKAKRRLHVQDGARQECLWWADRMRDVDRGVKG